MDTRSALTEGDTAEALTAVREVLAGSLMAAEPQQVAGIARQLVAVVVEQERRGAGREESKVDELAARRARRRGCRRSAGGAAEASLPDSAAVD